MRKRQLILIISSTIILAQIVLFRNYLPFISNKVIIEGQRCTCPDARVVSGETYFKKNTPDSLLKYELDFSEIYLENEVSTLSDPMGVKQYVVTGNIVGKRSVSKGDTHYYLLFRINHYNLVFLHNIIKWFIWGVLLIQLYILYRLIISKHTF